MKEFFKILKRFIPPYKKQLILNFLFNLLSALFTVFSMALMAPILEILFGMSAEVNNLLPWAVNLDVIKHNMYYYVTIFKEANGAGLTLLFVGFFVIHPFFGSVTFQRGIMGAPSYLMLVCGEQITHI